MTSTSRQMLANEDTTLAICEHVGTGALDLTVKWAVGVLVEGADLFDVGVGEANRALSINGVLRVCDRTMGAGEVPTVR
ncbi:hypothetical protein [Demequina zhanjiangensis]|uniref:Uncharacterized protein n=1 Tax=Demequina zhanjiangensis TaxID=3051659 RepID=A0ABT8G3I7_9MICO|nr:hypothetical protein [Demequina sp. SYSU T00b26]MDN4473717.1 hypothetical protein [Demequina sp. SYSU T00b26]